RPCMGKQFGQIVSHKYRFRVRTQPRLWAGAQDVLRAAPCCARDCEDHARPQRIISEEIGICYRRFGAANPARIFLLLSGRGSRGPLSRGVYRGSDQGPTAATDQSVISPPQTSSAASATFEVLPAFRCWRISRHRGATSPTFGARSPCSEDPSQILPSADSRAHVSEIRPLGSSSPPKPLGQSRRLRTRLNHVVFRTPALWTGVDLEPISAERRNNHRQLHFDAACRAIGLPW